MRLREPAKVGQYSVRENVCINSKKNATSHVFWILKKGLTGRSSAVWNCNLVSGVIFETARKTSSRVGRRGYTRYCSVVRNDVFFFLASSFASVTWYGVRSLEASKSCMVGGWVRRP